ncbi:MAG: NAD-dependent epimerase/dehydratase family protein [Deltaproteobacteria bacterium]|nr:NAD-dependent epimerase/dehydratase family protein [Deltaproteobacteria bacterium]
MNILVSGGTGFLGQAITTHLLREGHNVLILTRNRQRACRISFQPLPQFIQGDITKPETLKSAVEKMDAVVQCAQFPGQPVENRRKGFTYFNYDALGTENLVNAARNAGVKHFVYISGAGTKENAKEPWFKAKWYAEEAIRRSGIPATILRSSIVYGPGDKSLNRLIQMAKVFHILPLLGGGKNRVQPIFVDDLATIVAAALQNYPGKPIRTFSCGGPEEMTMKEMVQRALRFLGIKCLLFPVPAVPLNVVKFVTMDVSIDIAPLQKAFPQIRLKKLEEGLKTYHLD